MRAYLFYKSIGYSILFLVVSYQGFSQSPIPQLKEALGKTISAKEKADISFTISIWYSGRLKIDSGVFFANKIKDLSSQTGYEAGIGKHHLAMALALFYRGNNDEAEQNVLKAIEIFTRQKEILFLAG